MNDWFTVHTLDAGLWAIEDHGRDTCYLVAGRERALLIDTGWGIGDLPALAASLTPLPLTVVNTHGHPDHATGNAQFAEVHIAAADLPLTRHDWTPQQRARILGELLGGEFPPGFDAARWGRAAHTRLIPIAEGHRFDLGGRVLETLALPGHTPGSLCLLDRDARRLFSGDSLLAGTLWLHLDESLPLRAYRAALERLRAHADAFDTLLPGHGLPLPAGALLEDLIAGIGRILAGESTGEPTKTFAGNGLRCDFGSCALLYRAGRM